MSLLRERYRVDLSGLQAICELNYLRLLRLLPDMRDGLAQRNLLLSQGEQSFGQLHIAVLENCPYTTTLRLWQVQPLAWLPQACLQVRAYHDARMAEVVGEDDRQRLHGSYPYPNPAMYLPDEKLQVNRFLGEWLSHCQAHGYAAEALI